MTFGDVLAAIALLIAIVLSLCCGTVVVALVARRKVNEAKDKLIADPMKTVWRGVAALIATVLFFTGFESATVAPQKLLFAILLLLPAVAAIFGSAALSTLVAERLQPETPSLPDSRKIFQSALMCLGASLAPFVGWLLVLPVVLVISLGAGTGIMLPHKAGIVVAPDIQTVKEATL
jgi:MFS family permease